ncbi:hypothetical protein TBC1_11391 [Lentimicrobium saccharophilum]|uniref:Uncharacterized protein n=1 Tax=Lentimicrobium saccharophilum TaxID=1678841 RepID=A0A0S7BZ54_9BACT|nr:hypothetical protein TBC1_11391 [Lentimicrobium saccharophilum]
MCLFVEPGSHEITDNPLVNIPGSAYLLKRSKSCFLQIMF